jgi:hypothetical protein
VLAAASGGCGAFLKNDKESCSSQFWGINAALLVIKSGDAIHSRGEW